MKITTTDNYLHKWDGCLILEDCERRYCHEHRLLYRDCDSAVSGYEGDSDVVNGLHRIVEADGECPECLADAKRKRWERRMKEAI